ncbi:MAG: lipoyl synthase [Sandaracinaceae bacterium]|nr:lipoyl synthase [Sandaracinaceae bacterium]
MSDLPQRKPDWLRVRLPSGEDQARFQAVKERLDGLDLHTVCAEARCPNIFECWGAGTATIMVLGETCTRGCRFCAVNTGDPRGYVDSREPESTAMALERMGLRYVVITMVDRDDLLDGGAAHLAETVRRSKARSPELLIETLVGDFQGVKRDVRTVVREGAPDVFAHNVEVVPRLQRSIRDARCSWERSIEVLRYAKEIGAERTKTSLMVGIGEEESEVVEAMELIREAGVDILTIGQYLRPTKKHAEVKRYVHPDEFKRYEELGRALGFSFVASGPLVRSSYRAAEAFLDDTIRRERQFDRYGRRSLPVL